MSEPSIPHTSTAFRLLALATVIATYALVVVGGIVRVSGSGLGCPDWPLCQGRVIPQLQGATLIEFSHRIVSTVVTVLVLSTAVFAWLRYRSNTWVSRPAVLAVLLLSLQIVLGGITVLLELPPAIVGIHLGNALILFASLITATLFAFRPAAAQVIGEAWKERLARLALASTIGTFILILSGTVVTGTLAHYTCTTLPLCQDQLVPAGGVLPIIAAAHRYVAAAIGLVALYTFVETWRTKRHVPALMNASVAAAVLFVVQVAVGAFHVELAFPIATGILHLASAAAAWAAMVVFTILAFQTAENSVQITKQQWNAEERGQARMDPSSPRKSARGAIRVPDQSHTVVNYVLLSKPWIVALLLTTTLAAMLVAARGLPDLSILFFTLLGGALTSAGSSALNSYIDRDIDPAMGRTSRRPIPTGKIAPRNALIFGLVTCTLGVIVLAAFVNVLSALLAFAGIIYYVVIYTMFLKRSTPQNVVIGGAAGAIPPLVGWAAVTNEVNLFAVYLFLIIFYWTPPHTWALMLMVTKDYQKVQVPMMPAAHGEPETRRQIVLYSLLMVAITLIPVSIRDLGWLYLIAALLLGGWFIYLAVKIMCDGSKTTARRLYIYSNAYLALLFLAMVIDQSVVHILV